MAFQRLLLTCVLASFAAMTIAQDEYAPEFKPVVGVFSGLSSGSQEAILENVTPDFLLLEVGEVWDLEVVLSIVKPRTALRRNFFDVISVERFEGATLINYWNKALITDGSEQSTRAWLESVVVTETEGGWRLKQMHSTRIDPESFPDDVQFIELGTP